MSQSSYFKSRPEFGDIGGGGDGGGTGNLGKRLEWRGRDETWCVE